jgi:hypothetical protein
MKLNCCNSDQLHSALNQTSSKRISTNMRESEFFGNSLGILWEFFGNFKLQMLTQSCECDMIF